MIVAGNRPPRVMAPPVMIIVPCPMKLFRARYELRWESIANSASRLCLTGMYISSPLEMKTIKPSNTHGAVTYRRIQAQKRNFLNNRRNKIKVEMKDKTITIIRQNAGSACRLSSRGIIFED